MHLGIIAYQEYGRSVNWRNHMGNPMPDWHNLPINIRQAWIDAAEAVYKLREEDNETLPSV